MFCEKCGNRLVKNRCPNCDGPKPKKLIFILAVISVVSSFLAFHMVMMIIGMVYSAFVLGVAIYKYLQDKSYPRIGLSITLTIVGLISNLIWYLFVIYLL